MLQWGRVRSGADSKEGTSVTLKLYTLQWGRVRSGADSLQALRCKNFKMLASMGPRPIGRG